MRNTSVKSVWEVVDLARLACVRLVAPNDSNDRIKMKSNLFQIGKIGQSCYKFCSLSSVVRLTTICVPVNLVWN